MSETPTPAPTKTKRVIRYTPLAKIRTWERNPKTHAEHDLRDSMKRFGFTEPPIVDEKTGRLISGHGRIEALVAAKENGEAPPEGIQRTKKGEWLVPVVRGIEFKNDGEAEAYLIAANRLVEAGGWNEQELLSMLEEVVSNDLQGIGWTEKELEALLASHDPAPVGKTPAEKFEGFMDAEIKQVVLFFTGKDYDQVVERMDALLKIYGMENYSELLLKLLSEAEGNAKDAGTEEVQVSEGEAAQGAANPS